MENSSFATANDDDMRTEQWLCVGFTTFELQTAVIQDSKRINSLRDIIQFCSCTQPATDDVYNMIRFSRFFNVIQSALYTFVGFIQFHVEGGFGRGDVNGSCTIQSLLFSLFYREIYIHPINIFLRSSLPGYNSHHGISYNLPHYNRVAYAFPFSLLLHIPN